MAWAWIWQMRDSVRAKQAPMSGWRPKWVVAHSFTNGKQPFRLITMGLQPWVGVCRAAKALGCGCADCLRSWIGREHLRFDQGSRSTEWHVTLGLEMLVSELNDSPRPHRGYAGRTHARVR